MKAPSRDAGPDAPGTSFADSALPSTTGGAPGTGGVTATGGGMGGVGPSGTGGSSTTGVGGTIGTGGAVTAVGGRVGTGGSAGTAGATFGGTGGRTGTGGLPGTGGRPATGGTTGRGGVTGAGGAGTGGGAGGTGTGGIGGAGGGTASVLQPLVSAFCKAAKSCCGATTDLADCEAKVPSRMQIYPLVEKGTVTLDPTALAACVAAYTTAASTCTITAVKTACKGISVGNQAEGQPCGGASKFGAYECKPLNGTASCYRQQTGGTTASTGVCVAIPRGKSGDACSMTCLKGEPCLVDMVGGAAPFPVTCFEEDGVYCSVASNPAVCKPMLRLGDPCTWDLDSCGSGNFCGWETNTCLVASKLGQSCTNAYCVDGLECSTSSRCVEAPFASGDVCKGIPSAP